MPPNRRQRYSDKPGPKSSKKHSQHDVEKNTSVRRRPAFRRRGVIRHIKGIGYHIPTNFYCKASSPAVQLPVFQPIVLVEKYKKNCINNMYSNSRLTHKKKNPNISKILEDWSFKSKDSSYFVDKKSERYVPNRVEDDDLCLTSLLSKKLLSKPLITLNGADPIPKESPKKSDLKSSGNIKGTKVQFEVIKKSPKKFGYESTDDERNLVDNQLNNQSNLKGVFEVSNNINNLDFDDNSTSCGFNIKQEKAHHDDDDDDDDQDSAAFYHSDISESQDSKDFFRKLNAIDQDSDNVESLSHSGENYDALVDMSLKLLQSIKKHKANSKSDENSEKNETSLSSQVNKRPKRNVKRKKFWEDDFTSGGEDSDEFQSKTKRRMNYEDSDEFQSKTKRRMNHEDSDEFQSKAKRSINYEALELLKKSVVEPAEGIAGKEPIKKSKRISTRKEAEARLNQKLESEKREPQKPKPVRSRRFRKKRPSAREVHKKFDFLKKVILSHTESDSESESEGAKVKKKKEKSKKLKEVMEEIENQIDALALFQESWISSDDNYSLTDSSASKKKNSGLKKLDKVLKEPEEVLKEAQEPEKLEMEENDKKSKKRGRKKGLKGTKSQRALAKKKEKEIKEIHNPSLKPKDLPAFPKPIIKVDEEEKPTKPRIIPYKPIIDDDSDAYSYSDYGKRSKSSKAHKRPNILSRNQKEREKSEKNEEKYDSRYHDTLFRLLRGDEDVYMPPPINFDPPKEIYPLYGPPPPSKKLLRNLMMNSRDPSSDLFREMELSTNRDNIYYENYIGEGNKNCVDYLITEEDHVVVNLLSDSDEGEEDYSIDSGIEPYLREHNYAKKDLPGLVVPTCLQEMDHSYMLEQKISRHEKYVQSVEGSDDDEDAKDGILQIRGNHFEIDGFPVEIAGAPFQVSEKDFELNVNSFDVKDDSVEVKEEIIDVEGIEQSERKECEEDDLDDSDDEDEDSDDEETKEEEKEAEVIDLEKIPESEQKGPNGRILRERKPKNPEPEKPKEKKKLSLGKIHQKLLRYLKKLKKKKGPKFEMVQKFLEEEFHSKRISPPTQKCCDHNLKERERRKELQDLFRRLADEIPGMLDSHKPSKLFILHRATDHIKHLRYTSSALCAELGSLKSKQLMLRRRVEILLNSIPTAPEDDFFKSEDKKSPPVKKKSN